MKWNEANHLSLEWLGAYRDGELHAHEQASAESHLLTCDVCQTELEALEEVSDLLQMDAPARMRTTREQFAAQVMLQLSHTALQSGLPRWVKVTWKLLPLSLLAGWAFLQAVLMVTPLVMIFAASVMPAWMFSALSLPRNFSDLLPWLLQGSSSWVISPIMVGIGIEVVSLLALTGLLWGWLASWWAVQKSSLLRSS